MEPNHGWIYSIQELSIVVCSLRQQSFLLGLLCLRRLDQAQHEAIRGHHFHLLLQCRQELLLKPHYSIPKQTENDIAFQTDDAQFIE